MCKVECIVLKQLHCTFKSNDSVQTTRMGLDFYAHANAALSGRGPRTIQKTSKPLPAVRLNA